jgi:LmbE family N-acetylglucosaminyl deacetylase
MHPCHLLPFRQKDPELLCIGAHPDDIEIGCGGTILRICEEYPEVKVHWVVLGADGPRADEAKAGSESFRLNAGGGSLFIKGFRDGFFPFQGGPIKEFFEGLKTRVSPDVIFTHSRSDRHQDHRLVSDLTWNTWRDHTILEYEVPKWDGDLGRPNAFASLSEAVAQRKTELILRVFQSQAGKHWFSAETFMGLMRLRGNECRAGEGYAEAFHARKLLLL